MKFTLVSHLLPLPDTKAYFKFLTFQNKVYIFMTSIVKYNILFIILHKPTKITNPDLYHDTRKRSSKCIILGGGKI